MGTGRTKRDNLALRDLRKVKGHMDVHKHDAEAEKIEHACCEHTHSMETSSETLASIDDIECGPSRIEHFILSVTGLKCGCCETTLVKALRSIPSVKTFQINVVLARVEITLDTNRSTLDEVIVKLKRATGYTFVAFCPESGQVLGLMVEDAFAISELPKPVGVSQLEFGSKKSRSPSQLLLSSPAPGPGSLPPRVDSAQLDGIPPDSDLEKPSALYRHPVRVHYDPCQIGARTVFEHYQRNLPNGSVQLAPLSAHPELESSIKQVRRAFRVFAIAFGLTIPVLVIAYSSTKKDTIIDQALSLGLASLVQAIAIKEFGPAAIRTLIYSGSLDMNFLVLLSTSIAYIFSVVSFGFQVGARPLSAGSFFETSTLLVALIFLGRVIGESARLRAATSVSFRSLQTQEALLVLDGGETRKIDARLLQHGDRFKVPPHTRIVTDGKVIYGGSEVDESVVSGESIPVAKGLGHHVYAGSMNGAGQLVVALTALPHENSISRIATLVEQAELSKPRIQALADRIAGLFVPVIFLLGLIVFVTWVSVGAFVRHEAAEKVWVNALTHGIATLIVSCPCAIGLAVPMVVLIACGAAARHGIVFRDPQKIEIARTATHLVFDKTGTLTRGQLVCVQADYPGTEGHSREIPTKRLLMGLLEDNKHPVAVAILKYLGEMPYLSAREISSLTSIPGKGVRGICAETGAVIAAGNPNWLDVEVLDYAHTIFCVQVDGELAAVFRLEDKVRHDAEKVVDCLHKRGIEVHLISGDEEGTVQHTAHYLNIPRKNVVSRCSPAEKQAYIQNLQSKGAVVIFCGDGTNDSVALKQADVGVHMSHGCNVARGASDVILTSQNLYCIPIMLDISQAAYRRILFNFAWSALYNVVAILFAAGAFVKFSLPPSLAGLGELVSVLPVVGIAFCLKLKKFGNKYREKRWK